MAATAEQVRRLRRMIAEPTDATYSDGDLIEYIERRALTDQLGNAPYVRAATYPVTMMINPNWTPTYDLHGVAAVLWGEKASALAALFDYSADGASFSRKQQYDNAQAQQRYHAARRSARTIEQIATSGDTRSATSGSSITNYVANGYEDIGD